MQPPVRYSRGRMRFTGRLPRASFDSWADSPDGYAYLQKVASELRFAPFGRMRAARRLLWRQLRRAARTPTVLDVVQRELDAYLGHLDPLVYAQDLPRVSIDLHRLVVVPRLFVNAEVYRGVDAALTNEHAFAPIPESLRDSFVVTLVHGIEAGVAGARPSPQRPLPAGAGWILVGVNERFEWGISLHGPAWSGHYYVLEETSTPITRAIRKAAADAIARLETSLPSLSRVHRSEILRQAGLSVEHLFARA